MKRKKKVRSPNATHSRRRRRRTAINRPHARRTTTEEEEKKSFGANARVLQSELLLLVVGRRRRRRLVGILEHCLGVRSCWTGYCLTDSDDAFGFVQVNEREEEIETRGNVSNGR